METIFNFFPIVQNKIVSKYGFVVHRIEGSDQEKIDFLKDNLLIDFPKVDYEFIPDSFQIKVGNADLQIGISHENYNKLSIKGDLAALFELTFKKYGASKNPLFISTMVDKNGIKIEKILDIERTNHTNKISSVLEHLPQDYLEKYTSGNSFNFGELINDDFLKASKLLYNNGYFVSTLKLLLSSVDSIAFLEFGDIPLNFKKWLNQFADVEQLDITVDELWEFRNALLHMTNANSRKVVKGEISKILFYIHKEKIKWDNDGRIKYFNLKILIDVLNDAIVTWIKSFEKYPNKFGEFFERYDQIASDTRYGKIIIG